MKLIKATELSNSEYHGERSHYSSSQLKMAVSDIEAFHRLYVLGEKKNVSIPAFDIGQYYHTAILEPEKLGEECAIFTGKMRRGKDWDAFKVKHEGKAIITNSEYAKAQTLIESTQNNEIVKWLMQSGEAELSCFSRLGGLDIKVRADWIDLERGFLMDLKSTTGNTREKFKIQKKIAEYDYDLSAALYVDAFNAALGKEVIKDFYWPFATKDSEYANCTVYRATKANLAVGRAKYTKALQLIKKYEKAGWVFCDEIVDVDAAQWDKELWTPKKEEKNIKQGIIVSDSDYL